MAWRDVSSLLKHGQVDMLSNATTSNSVNSIRKFCTVRLNIWEYYIVNRPGLHTIVGCPEWYTRHVPKEVNV